ncbi:MAG: cell division protein SepF [Candidatus Bathyarchaeia archaeon]
MSKLDVKGNCEEKTQAPSALSDIYVKALPLRDLADVSLIKDEVRAGNVLIVRVTPLAKKSVDDVKRAINELHEYVGTLGGDIARLGEERIVLTPPPIKIWRKKSASVTAEGQPEESTST